MQEANNTFSNKDFEEEKIPSSIFEFFYYRKINEEHYEFFCAHKEIVKEYAGYFFITLHSALFSSSKYADCLMNVLRETKEKLVGTEAKIQAEFYEDVYEFLKKDKKQQRKEIFKLCEKYKRVWHGALKESIGAQAIKVSVAYLFIVLGVEIPEPEEKFMDFNARVYVPLDTIESPNVEDLVKHLGFIPTDMSAEHVLMDYYDSFSGRVFTLKFNTKSIFSSLRKHKCKTTYVKF